MRDREGLTEAGADQHWGEMPLSLSGEEWEPEGKAFERARTTVARKLKWARENVMDWEVRSYLRERETGTTALQPGALTVRRLLDPAGRSALAKEEGSASQDGEKAR